MINLKFNILNKTKYIVEHIYEITSQSPKKYLRDFSSELRSQSLQLLLKINRANIVDDATIKQQLQREALLTIHDIECLIVIGVDLNIITKKQFSFCCEQLSELNNSIIKWSSL